MASGSGSICNARDTSASQALAFLPGDYAAHAHGTVLPAGLLGGTVAIGALLLYVVHLASLDVASLPTLARSLRSQIGVRSIFFTTVAACIVLVGMEGVEQLRAGRFDGLTSGLSAWPGVGFAILGIASAAGNALLHVLFGWLAGVHVRLVSAIAVFLRGRADTTTVPLLVLRRSLATPCYARNVPQACGERAPPIPR